MIELIVNVFWFLLPAGIANMAPVLFKWINFLNYPLDFNKKFRKKPIFGKNKTYRGLIFGVLMAIIMVYIQKLIGIDSIVNYESVNIVLLGFLLGFGALIGDIVKSFFKRQLDIKPGKPFVPADQLDWIIGALFFTSFYVGFTWGEIMTAIVMFGILHPLINLLGYAMRIKKNKF